MVSWTRVVAMEARGELILGMFEGRTWKIS